MESYQTFRCDLHLHSVLSPCGELEMSPRNMIQVAKERQLDVIALTDHNSAGNVRVMAKLAEEAGLIFVPGLEVTSKEEAHLLCYFPDCDRARQMDKYVYRHLPKISNKPDYFGYQVLVDEEDNILGFEEYLLISATELSAQQIAEQALALGGFCVPAHIDRKSFSLLNQLGFIPPDLPVQCVEISYRTTAEEMRTKYPFLKPYTMISSSDAHMLQDIGKVQTHLRMPSFSFELFRETLCGRSMFLPQIVPFHNLVKEAHK